TSANFNIGCLVTVTGLQDLDVIDQNLAIRVSAPGLGVPDAFVNVRKTEDDVQALVLSAPPCGTQPGPRDPNLPPPGDTGDMLNVVEQGLGQQVCVSLAFEPLSPITTQVMASSPKVAASPGALTFTAASYFLSQPVIVTGVADDNDTTDEIASITISPIPLAPPKVVMVHVADNDRLLTVVATLGGQVTSSPAGIAACGAGSGDCVE